jgi:hypothetical protein
MNLKPFVLAAALAVGSTPAWANHCPRDMKQIDAALAQQPALTAEQLAQVKRYRAEGEALHDAGRHAESVAELAKAKALLGID